MPLAPGDRLGPYLILGPIGSGGMGAVYRARDPRLSRDVALKVIATEGPPSAERLRRFEDEARAVASLSHPNVLTVFDVGERDGEPYVVFELLEGEALRERLQGGPLPLRWAVETGIEVCRGLQAAHARGILHRDLKPENLFLTSDGVVKILDFGLAKLTRGEGAEGGGERTQTVAGVVMGTPAYLSPEQARGQEADARSDIFALGAILYEALSGRRAFARATAADTISAILHEEPPPLLTVCGPLPAAVERIVRRCLAKEREDRFHSAHDLALALEAVLEAPVAASLQDVEDRPYPGLSCFTEKDAGVFFGREAEVEALWGKIRQKRLLAVIGPSGAGKTSFLRAGVIPSRPDGWAAVHATPGANPALGLAHALTPALAGDPDAVRDLIDGVTELAQAGEADRVVSAVRRWRARHAEVLLVVDQLEELFTLSPASMQERFAVLLARLADDAGAHVVLALRDDFLLRCFEQEPLAPSVTPLTVMLPLKRDALRRALVEPARRRGYRFEDEALVSEMVEAVEGSRGALPLLAFAVAGLWERRDRETRILTRAAYQEMRGVGGALAQHAEGTMDRIPPERQGLVREIFRNLVTARGTRAVVDREDLLSAFPDRAATEEVLRQLTGARLVTSYEVEGRAGETSHHRIEVVHESLLAAWPRLVRWQAQDEEGALLRDQLKQAAHLWEEKGRSPDLLWVGTAYREYALWRSRYRGALTATEEQYAKAMVDRAGRRRRLRRGAVAAAFLVLAGVSIAIAASRHQAAKARDQARAEALRAQASRLVTLAQLRLAADPTEALAYATASLELADTPEARVFVMKALWEAPPAFTLPVGPPPQRGASFSPDGTRLVALDHDPVQLLLSESGGAPTPLAGHEISERGSNVAGWSADGHLVTGMCCGLSTRVQVWSIEGNRLRTIEFGAPTWWQVGKERVFGETEEGPPGSRVLRLRSWRLPDGQASVLGRVARGVRGSEVPSAFLPDATGWVYARGNALFVRPLAAGGTIGGEGLAGRHPADIDLLWADERARDRLISRDKTGEMRIWKPVAGRLDLDRVIPRPATAPPSVFPAELRWALGHAWQDKKVRLWDLEALPGSRPLELRRSGSWYLAWSHLHPRGDWVTVFQYREGRAAFWPLRKRYPSVVDGYTAIHRPVAFSPDGRWLATTWADSTLRLWPLSGDGPREPSVLEGPPNLAWSVIVFDPHGRYVLAVGASDSAWIVPLDGTAPRRLPAYAEDSALFAAAASPSGRRVATGWNCCVGPKAPRTLRLHDVETGETRMFPLPTEPASSRFASPLQEGALDGIGFLDETTAYTSGWAGLRRWDLEKGTSERVAADVDFLGFLGSDRRLALTGAPVPGRDAKGCRQLQTRDLVSGKTKAVGSPGVCVGAPPAAVSGDIVAVPGPDGVRVGRLSNGALHLLVGHEGSVDRVAVSPDGRWVATSGEDNTLRLWPMPDLSEPPLHTLPHDELLAKLKSLTNIRVVRAPESPRGWKIEIGPFPGWKDVPTW